MRRQRTTWAALIGAPLAVELAAVLTGRTDWTLSPTLRWALRCETPGGQAFTIAAVGSSAAWLAHHLITIPAPQES